MFNPKPEVDIDKIIARLKRRLVRSRELVAEAADPIPLAYRSGCVEGINVSLDIIEAEISEVAEGLTE